MQTQFDRAFAEYLGPRRPAVLDAFVDGFDSQFAADSLLRSAIREGLAQPQYPGPVSSLLLDEGLRSTDAVFDEYARRIRVALGRIDPQARARNHDVSLALALDRVCWYGRMWLPDFSPESLHAWLVGGMLASAIGGGELSWSREWHAIERELGPLDAPWYRVARTTWGPQWSERLTLAARRVQTRVALESGRACEARDADGPRARRDPFRRFRESYLGASDPALWDAYVQGFDAFAGPVFLSALTRDRLGVGSDAQPTSLWLRAHRPGTDRALFSAYADAIEHVLDTQGRWLSTALREECGRWLYGAGRVIRRRETYSTAYCADSVHAWIQGVRAATRGTTFARSFDDAWAALQAELVDDPRDAEHWYRWGATRWQAWDEHVLRAIERAASAAPSPR